MFGRKPPIHISFQYDRREEVELFAADGFDIEELLKVRRKIHEAVAGSRVKTIGFGDKEK